MTINAFVLNLLIVFTAANSLAQDKEKGFMIDGVINVDTGTVELYLIADSSYYPKSFTNKTKVEGGKFAFKGTLMYPQAVEISYNNNRSSGLFLIDAGQQFLKLDTSDLEKVPDIDNEVMKEYYSEFRNAYSKERIKNQKFRRFMDSLYNSNNGKIPQEYELSVRKTQSEIYQRSDSIKANYIATHPDSYLSLWKLVEMTPFGYEPVFDSAFTKLSTKLKSTHTGQRLAKTLATGRMLGIGKAFPSIECYSQTKSPLQISDQNKFTLVDFWYSSCSPCIAQFPMLSSLYKQYHGAGFEIIGISTDRRKHEGAWKKIIANHKLPWLQYWDVDGLETTKLSINAFPTNFLLDAKKQIIRKNISPAELEQFLQENLN